VQRPLTVDVADHPHDLSNKRCKSKRTTLRAFEIHRSPPLAGNLDKYLILKPYRRNIFFSVRIINTTTQSKQIWLGGSPANRIGSVVLNSVARKHWAGQYVSDRRRCHASVS